MFQKAVSLPDMTNSVSLPSFIGRRILFSSWTLCNTSFLTRSVKLISPSFSNNEHQNFPRITFRGVQSGHHAQLCSKCSTFLISSLNLSPICFWRFFFFFLNAAFAMTILYLISRVHLAPFVIMLPKRLKYCTLSDCFYLYWGWLAWDSITFAFSTSFRFHIIFQFQLFFQTCPVAPLLP